MKHLNNFWFGFLLAASVAIIPICFMYADAHRGYDSTGGEVFMIALPFLLWKWRRWAVEQKKQSVQHHRPTQQQSLRQPLQDIRM
jgi:hypothetical protein